MDNTEAAANCHTMPKSDVPLAPSLLLSLPDIVNLPRLLRQRKAPPPREVTTLCGAEQELGLPQWHQESLTALQDHSLGPDWIGLVEKWYQLESSMWKIKAEVHILCLKSMILTDCHIGQVPPREATAPRAQ